MRTDILILFTKPFWMDEWHALLVANRPSLSAVISDLHQGSDFAPPLLHVILWSLRMITGGTLSPWVARALMLACTLLALWFVYRVLRRRLGTAASLAGAMAIATHPMIVAYAFEVRFYAPWLLFAAGFAWALSLDAERVDSRRRDVAVAVLSVLVCTIHWYGVLTLGLMCVAAAATDGRNWRAGIRRVVPAAAGVIALLAFLPLLMGQRSAIVENSWLPPLDWPQFRELARVFWGATLPGVAVATLLIVAVRRTARDALRATVAGAVRDPGVAALLALAAMPLVLTVISLRQPAMLPRYGIAAFLAWAPLVGLAVHVLPRAARVGVVGLLAFAALLALGAQVGTQRQVASAIALDRAVLTEACRTGPVAFITRVQMYYHTNEIMRGCARAKFLLMPPEILGRLFAGQRESGRRSFYRSENEFARLHERLYGFPSVLTPMDLDTVSRFVLIAEPAYLPRDANGEEYFSRVVFPRHKMTPLTGNGARFDRAR